MNCTIDASVFVAAVRMEEEHYCCANDHPGAMVSGAGDQQMKVEDPSGLGDLTGLARQ
jgi:hypothetical protein